MRSWSDQRNPKPAWRICSKAKTPAKAQPADDQVKIEPVGA